MGKPHKEPYCTALERCGTLREKSLVVENAPMGIASAKAAGLFCVALETTLSGDDLKGADRIISTHGELRNFLLKYLREI